MASGRKAMKKSNKVQKNITKKRRPKRKSSYGIYIYRILKEIHPNTDISNKAMRIINRILIDIFKQIATVSSIWCHCNNRSTITSWDILNAVRLSFPGKLAVYAAAEGIRAITKLNSSK